MTNGYVERPQAVRIETRVDAQSGWVELDPAQARIVEGGTATWVFTGVPDGLRPALLFESFIPDPDADVGSADPPLNPFGQVSWQGDEIHGSEFGGLAGGEYMYKICLLAADGSDPLVHKLQCRNAPAGGLVHDPGPRAPQKE